MKKALLLSVFILCGISTVFAQTTLPDKCEVFCPDVLLSSIVLKETQATALEKSADYGQKKSPRNKTFWVAYSDRDDNLTFDAPGSYKKFSSLSLNDKVRIAQIKNGYALVYIEPQVDIAFPMISQNAECKGWISMKNLLLWHSCPANEAGIYNKALLCVNLDKTHGNDLGNIYKNPKNKSKYDQLSADMEFYYVMKREGNLALLSRYHTTDGRSDKVLMGWVADQSYVAWNQRSCIEPSWDRRDVEYFADEGREAKVYSNKQLDTCVFSIRFSSRNEVSRDPHLYRMHPDMLRYPILDDGTSDLYNCSTFGGGGPVVIGGDVKKESALGYSEEILREMTNINIGIVIDGTSSMESFYPAVKDAIKKGVKYFDGDKYKIKVGVVIYRDYSDGEYVTETMPLTPPANPKLDMFLDSGGKYGIRSSRSDRTLEEAMYTGINVALDQLKFDAEQSNLLLVVGDCGNDRDDKKVTSDMIIDKLVDKNVHMMAFQVRKGDEDAFSLFNAQLQTILYKSLQRKYANLNWTGALKMKETTDGYSLVNDVNSNLYIGSHNMPVIGQAQMKMDRLSELMQDAIMYCSQSVQHQIDLITAWQHGGFSGGGDTGIDMNEEFVKSRLGDAYEEYKKTNAMASFKGYTPKVDKSGRSYFKPVVFISADELNDLLDRLKPVNEAAVTENNDRAPYVKAMTALAQSMVGGTDSEISRLGVQEIMSMVAGLNEAAGALKGYTIAEIASPQAVPEWTYLSLVEEFKRKYRALSRLKGAPYKYTRTLNGLKYYWLPVEDLP